MVEKTEKKMLCCMICFFLLSCIPLYVISDYAHPSVDDYSYGTFTARVWQETGSIRAVLANAWERTAHTYKNWQGTFSSIFLMRLQPAVFGEQYYFLTTVFLLTIFIMSSLLLFRIIFGTLFCATDHKQSGSIKIQAWIVSFTLVFGQIQFTHVACDSFYWYNGGVTYTFFYAMESFLFALLIVVYRTHIPALKLCLGLICAVLAFFTCGGNYVTSLVTVEILFFILAVYILKQKHSQQKWFSMNLCVFAIVFVAAVAGFFVAVLAPGNAIRQESVGEPMNPFLAVALSFVYGAYSIANCLRLPVLILLLFCIPFFINIARSCLRKCTSFRFRCPGLVTLLSFCLYSSQITPVIYAQGIKIPYRIMNIIYFSCIVVTAVNLFYWIGFIIAKTQSSSILLKESDIFKKKNVVIYSLLLLFLFCTACVGHIDIAAEMQDSGAKVEITGLPASLSAAYSIVTGEAAQYDKEAWQRYQAYSDPKQSHVVVEPFTVRPDILFHADITANKKNWKNQCVKKFFGKQSVRLRAVQRN